MSADGGQGWHSADSVIVRLSLHEPFIVHGEEWAESMLVGLDIDLEDTVGRDGEPHLTIVPRDDSADATMILTLAEGEELIRALAAMIATGRAAGPSPARRRGSPRSWRIGPRPGAA